MSMMHFPLRLCPNPAKKVIPSPRTYPEVLSEKSHQPLGFWYIQPHDRETFIEYIMPYMAGSLRKKHLLQTVVERHTWATELVKSEHAELAGHDSVCFRQTTTVFWKDPAAMAMDLLQLTRSWFFMLLRYTYRRRIFDGRETSLGHLDLQHLCNDPDGYYISGLTEDAIYRLTCLQNKYGASYYRRSYKDATQRLGWTSFCERIQSFCQSIGLHTISNDPEKNLQELRHNLTAIMMHRKFTYISGQLAKNTVLIRIAREDVKKLDERVSSGAMHDDEIIEEMKRDIEELDRQSKELQLTAWLRDEPRLWDVKMSAELDKFRTTNEKRLKKLSCNVQQSDITSKQLIRSLESRLDKLRNELGRVHTHEEKHANADALDVCRWLLENLPAGNTRMYGFGCCWRQFWDKQWNQCTKKTKRDSHPLWEVISDEKYNSVGRHLYSTLSNRLHEYGHQRGEKLHPDAQRVVDAIRPVHYDKDGKINLAAERKRWTV